VTIEAFALDLLPMRVVFGAGAVARVTDEVRAVGGTRVFLIAGDSAKAVADDVGDVVARWGEVVQHVPLDLATRARAAVDVSHADAVVCVGGGSAVGLAKAIALSHELPVVAVVTTYSGSEMTPIYGLTGGSRKQTGRSRAVLPKVVIYDPELTVSLPPQVTGPSAGNALAHCVEGLWVSGHNPITSATALHAVRLISAALPGVMAHPDDLDGRGDLLLGACLAGSVIAATGTGLHHRICHVLGGMFNLAHADTHSVVLPHVVAFNGPAVPREMIDLAAALGCPGADPAGALWDLAEASGVATILAALGMPADGLAAAAARVASETADNPVPVSATAIEDLLDGAYRGRRPGGA
jgi:maleylacetate reductase